VQDVVVVLEGSTLEVAVDPGTQWVLVNAGQRGFVRVHYQTPQLRTVRIRLVWFVLLCGYLSHRVCEPSFSLSLTLLPQGLLDAFHLLPVIDRLGLFDDLFALVSSCLRSERSSSFCRFISLLWCLFSLAVLSIPHMIGAHAGQVWQVFHR
jgi:hypothetical protein